MYERAFKLQSIAPDRVLYDSGATSLSAPGVCGGFQVLYNHAPLLSALEVGRMKVKDLGGTDSVYATSGGFVEVRDNTVVVLVESAERAGEIDVERAQAARARALERLRGAGEGIDLARARAALERAMNRLRIAARIS